MDAESKWYVSRGRLAFLTGLAAIFWVVAALDPDRWWRWAFAGIYTAFIAVSWGINLLVRSRQRER